MTWNIIYSNLLIVVNMKKKMQIFFVGDESEDKILEKYCWKHWID